MKLIIVGTQVRPGGFDPDGLLCAECGRAVLRVVAFTEDDGTIATWLCADCLRWALELATGKSPASPAPEEAAP